jgi:DNA modification methylase
MEGTIWDGQGDCEHNFSVSAPPRRNRSIEDVKNPDTVSKIQSGNKGSQHDLPYTNFCIKCGAWKGQLGLEPSFDLYVKHLCDIFDEVKRILTRDGTCWINIGDTYQAAPVSGKQGGFSGKAAKDNPEYGKAVLVGKPKSILKNKTLLQIPARFAIEMCNRGWILRNDIIWHKPNCMPVSVRDRFTVDFEHVFFFVKNQKYYFEQQFEVYSRSTLNDKRFEEAKKGKYTGGTNIKQGYEESGAQNPIVVRNNVFNAGLGEGRNKRSVWTITVKGFRGAHFAVFPPELLETPIKAGCPEFVCKKCKVPRKKIITREHVGATPYFPQHKWQKENGVGPRPRDIRAKKEFAGYTDCGCNVGFDNGIVLDIFMGSGTTAVVAKKLNRNYIGIELSPEFIDIAEKRINGLPVDKFKGLKQDNTGNPIYKGFNKRWKEKQDAKI